MMTLPIPVSPDQLTKAPPAPRGVAFITLSEAHRRSGTPMQTLARRCRGEWCEKSLAFLMPPTGGGKPCWHVREDADPHFARAKSPEALPFDWGQVTDAQRAVIRQRKAVLDAWSDCLAELMMLGRSEREATAEFVKRQGGTTRRTLFRWRRAWRTGGWAGLLDSRRDRQGEPDGQEFIDELKRLYLSPRQRGVALCYTMACDAAAEKGWPIPFGERRAQQILAAVDRKVVAFQRLGPRAYDGTHGKYIQRDYSQLASNELWNSDGHDFNVFVLHDGKLIRPTLVSWIDVRSRKCVGWRIIAGAENADVVLAAFKMGVMAYGLPLGVYHDNGRAFDSQSLQGITKSQRRRGARPQPDLGVFERLDVRVYHARPYNAKAKLIERWHRTIDERFSRRFDTYCGGNTMVKPYDLQQNKDAGKALTLEEFSASFGDWLDADYHGRVHDGEGMDGKTPAQVYVENLSEKRIISPDLLDLELSRRELVTVGRNGVTVNGLTYEAPELDARSGQELIALVDADTLGRVRVLDREGRFLCQATPVRHVPVNAKPEELREAMAGIKRDRKRVKAAASLDARMRIADDPIERMHRQAEARRAAAPQPATGVIQPVRSKLEGDLRAIKEADAARPAPKPIRAADMVCGRDKPEEKYPYVSLADLMRPRAVNQ